MILCLGDSFTFGEELKNPARSAWPALLSKLTGMPVENQGMPGSGNHRLIKELINSFTSKKPLTAVIICWTSAHRQEHADQAGAFDIWPGCSGRTFTSIDTVHRKQLIKYITEYHNDVYDYRNWLRQVYTAQILCESNGVPYVFFNAYGNEILNKKYMENVENKHLIESVNTQHFVGWPYQGIVEWVYDLPKGPGGHTLEQGHQLIAEKIYEHIRNQHWVS